MCYWKFVVEHSTRRCVVNSQSKVMMKITLNRWSHKRRRSSLKIRQASEQEGTPQSRSSTYKSSEKYVQHQQDLYHVFRDVKEDFRQGLECSFVGNHEELQNQHQPYPSHQKPLWQGPQCRPLQQQHMRLVPNNSWSPTGMSTLTHPLQHISGKDHDRRLRGSPRHFQTAEVWSYLPFIRSGQKHLSRHSERG